MVPPLLPYNNKYPVVASPFLFFSNNYDVNIFIDQEESSLEFLHDEPFQREEARTGENTRQASNAFAVRLKRMYNFSSNI